MRIKWIDCLRGFAIVLVTYGHVIIALGFGDNPIKSFMYSFHMPLFFVISGFVVALSVHRKNIDKLDSWLSLGFVGRKASCILAPYLCWCLILKPLFLWAYGDKVCYSALLHSTLIDNTALWFLPTLFLLTCLFALYKTVIGSSSSTLRWGGVFILQVVVILLWLITRNGFVHRTMNYILPYFLGVLAAEGKNYLILNGRRFVFALLGFCVGAGVFIAGANVFGDTWILCRVARLVTGLFSAFVFFSLFEKLNGNTCLEIVLGYIGKNTLVIYALPMPFAVFAITKQLCSSGLNDWTCGIIALPLSALNIAAALLVAKVASSNKILNRLIAGK